MSHGNIQMEDDPKNEEEDIHEVDAVSSIVRSEWFALGLGALVVVCQVTSANIGQQLQTTYDYNKPYFITYFNTMWMILCFPLQFILWNIQKHKHFTKESEPLQKPPTYSPEVPPRRHYKRGFISSLEEAGERPLWKLLLLSFPFALLWFLANYAFVNAIIYTSVASALTLEQTATVTIFILSVIFLQEKVLFLKVLAVAGCVGGAVMVAFGEPAEDGDSDGDNHPLEVFGDALALISAVCAASYMVFYKKLLGNLNFPAVNAFLTCIAISSTLLLWPGLIIVSVTNYESFQFPQTGDQILFFILNAFTGFLFNLFLNIGVYFTSPLHMKVATIVAIPVSFLVDYLLGNLSLSVLKICGAVMITVGYSLFSAVELVQNERVREKLWFDVDLGEKVSSLFS